MAVIVINNLIDYGSNYEVVRHVLLMDDIFPTSTLRWRAIESPAIHHVFYGTIIAWEGVVALLLAAGAVRMALAQRGDVVAWDKARGLAETGLALGLLLWLLAFMAVGGEWFVMWQSKTWNALPAAFRMFGVQGFVLLYLRQADEAT
jgi:predicted small integral membrane protein